MTIHNNRKTERSMPAAGFEPAIQASERLHSDALEGAVTGITETAHLKTQIKFRLHNFYRLVFTILAYIC
jgi:hypothetical protein